MKPMFVKDDGGREAAGFRGLTGDCGVRAVAIATGLSYREVYDGINAVAAIEGARGRRRQSNARTGVWPYTITRFLKPMGWEWVPTMKIGQGCTTHVDPAELPSDRLVLRLSKHYAAMIDGVLHDTHDCSRSGTRCVYGYWKKGL